MRADDTPDEYPPVDDQLLADYPELAALIERDDSWRRRMADQERMERR